MKKTSIYPTLIRCSFFLANYVRRPCDKTGPAHHTALGNGLGKDLKERAGSEAGVTPSWSGINIFMKFFMILQGPPHYFKYLQLFKSKVSHWLEY